LKLPAETKHPLTVKLGSKSWKMKADSLLFPTRLGREELDRISTGMTELHYAGQFLQEPIPIGGGEFRDDWVQWYEPGTLNPRTMNICILCDPAGGAETNSKKRKTSDYTAMMVVGLAPDNNYYLLDMVRDRLNPTERIDTLFQMHRKWNGKAGKPPKVGYEKYGMMSDTHYLKEKQKQESYHFPIIELGGKVMKEERIRRLIPDMQQLRWYFPTSMVVVDKEGRRPDLVHELIYSEMPPFPLGRYDDMLDALSRVYDVEMLMLHPQLIAKKEPHERQRQSQSWMDY
jgi:predicted phage terminase large subunit-like protein